MVRCITGRGPVDGDFNIEIDEAEAIEFIVSMLIELAGLANERVPDEETRDQLLNLISLFEDCLDCRKPRNLC
jgi:hypothetical protein